MATNAKAADLGQLDGVPGDWARVSIDNVPSCDPADQIDAVINALDQLLRTRGSEGLRHQVTVERRNHWHR